MSFDISYSFRAIDKFTKVADKVTKSTEKVNRKIRTARVVNRKLARSFDKVKSSISRANTPLKKFSRNLGGLKSVIGVAAIGLGFKKLIDVGARFEDALVDLSIITGITGDQLAKSAETAKKFGLEFGVLPSNVLAATKQIASAKSELIGIDGALEKVTRAALTLSTAGNVPLTDATETLTLALNQFGASADQANRFINVLQAGSKIGASEIFETAEVIRNAGVNAKASGVDFETFNALLQVLAKQGIKAERAGTALKTLFVKLDVEFGKAGQSSLSFTEKLEALKGKTQDAEFASKLFGLEAISAGRALALNTELTKLFTKGVTGTAEATKAATSRMGTFSFALKRLGVQLRLKIIALFERSRKSLEKFANQIGSFLDSITTEDIDKFAESIKVLASALGGLVKLAIKLKPLFSFIFNPRIIAAFAGLKAGGALGAAVGTVVPGAGTAAGGFVGGLAGAAAGFFGASKLLENKPGNAISNFANPTPGPQATQSEINVNINAPKDTVRSVQSKSTGPVKLNVGNNLRFAGGTP